MSARAPYIHLTSPQLFADDLSQIKQTVDEVLRPRFEELMRELPLSTIEQERDDRNAARHDAIYAQNRAFHMGLAQVERTPEPIEPVQQPSVGSEVIEGFEPYMDYGQRHGLSGKTILTRMKKHLIKMVLNKRTRLLIRCDTPPWQKRPAGRPVK